MSVHMSVPCDLLQGSSLKGLALESGLHNEATLNKYFTKQTTLDVQAPVLLFLLEP